MSEARSRASSPSQGKRSSVASWVYYNDAASISSASSKKSSFDILSRVSSVSRKSTARDASSRLRSSLSSSSFREVKLMSSGSGATRGPLPDVGLLLYRHLFTRTHKCSRCKSRLNPSRSLVCAALSQESPYFNSHFYSRIGSDRRRLFTFTISHHPPPRILL